MRKSIVKTICISALLFVCFAVGIFGVLSVAIPKTMAEYYDSIGLTELSLSCSDICYSSSADINDQFAMFNKAVNAGNSELTKKYAKKLLDNKNINEFSDFLGSQYPNNPHLQNEKNRIVEHYVRSLYNTKQVNTAVDYAFSVLETSEINAKFIVAINGLDKGYVFSSTQKKTIVEKYKAMFNYFKAADAGLNKGIVAVRLTDLLEVILRFENSETYTSDFNEIKAELEKW